MILEVPNAATHALAEVIARGLPFDGPEYRRAVREIAAPVVVAELRRLAREHDRARRRGAEMVLPSTGLRRRAAAIESGAA